MPNIHGLHSNARRPPADDASDSDDDNDRYVGGVDSRGGGSGLAVVPNRDGSTNNDNAASDAIFNLAEAAGSGGGGGGGGGEVRRTITMYRSGFVVDNGPYRRLDDPDNAEFLSSLARGMVPRELRDEASGGDGEVAVGLVDRRGEEYDADRHNVPSAGGRGGGRAAPEPEFQSFAGEGQSLGGTASSAAAAGGVITPSEAGTPQPVDASKPSTSVAVRLLNGKRLVVKLNVDAAVAEIGAHIGTQAGEDPYVLTSGYPPAAITDLGQTVEGAGLKGAQVVMKKA